MRFHLHTRRSPERPYPAELKTIIGMGAHRAATAEVTRWSGYERTPMRTARHLAREIGIGELWVKDESRRFGLGSFKALGGAYGVLKALEATANPSTLTVTCASDGNHGRSVAWGARRFGCSSVIYLPRHVTPGREDAIRTLGATVVRVDGEYDDAVAEAHHAGQRDDHVVVSDTSYAGYDALPRAIMQGYTIMVAEAMEQLDGRLPSHVFIQGGVGGLAAAVLGHIWEAVGGAHLPRFVVVEPESADGLYQSALVGSPVPATGDLATVMAGLSCREVSPLAWQILEAGTFAFMTVADEGVPALMRRLASGKAGEPVEAGESGVAGLLGLLEASGDMEIRETLGLNDRSVILVFNTEGATDPTLYRQILDGPGDGA